MKNLNKEYSLTGGSVDELVEYTPYIIRRLERLGVEDVEDATQEVLLHCCKNWHLRNEHYRLHKFIDLQLKEIFRKGKSVVPDCLVDDVSDSLYHTPHHFREVVRGRLREAVKTSHSYVQALYEGATPKQVAELNNVSRQAVEKQWKIFQTCIENQYC